MSNQMLRHRLLLMLCGAAGLMLGTPAAAHASAESEPGAEVPVLVEISPLPTVPSPPGGEKLPVTGFAFDPAWLLLATGLLLAGLLFLTVRYKGARRLAIAQSALVDATPYYGDRGRGSISGHGAGPDAVRGSSQDESGRLDGNRMPRCPIT